MAEEGVERVSGGPSGGEGVARGQVERASGEGVVTSERRAVRGELEDRRRVERSEWVRVRRTTYTAIETVNRKSKRVECINIKSITKSTEDQTSINKQDWDILVNIQSRIKCQPGNGRMNLRNHWLITAPSFSWLTARWLLMTHYCPPFHGSSLPLPCHSSLPLPSHSSSLPSHSS